MTQVAPLIDMDVESSDVGLEPLNVKMEPPNETLQQKKKMFRINSALIVGIMCAVYVAFYYAIGPGAAPKSTVLRAGSLKLKMMQLSGSTPSCPPLPANAATEKMGLGDMMELNNTATCNDADIINLENSWWYDWSGSPKGNKNICAGKHKIPLAKEWMPMAHGLQVPTVDSATQSSWVQANALFLLGYNEPDGKLNPITPAAAAATWPKVQSLAAQFDPPLILVSPVCYSNGVDSDGRCPWLDQFYGNCTGECDPSLIKYTAFHDYTGDADLMMQRLQGSAQIYNRPIMLTEYGIINDPCDSKIPPPSDTQHVDYLKQTIPLLEEASYVARFAWFSGRQVPNQCAGSAGEFVGLTQDLDHLGYVIKNYVDHRLARNVGPSTAFKKK